MQVNWNKKLWRWHHYLGVYVGLAIIFLSITGCLALFKVEIDRLLNPGIWKVEPVGERMPMQTALSGLQEAFPELKFFEIHLPRTANEPYNFRFFPRDEPIYQRQLIEVFVNPYNGEILTRRDYFSTFSYFLRNIHVRFFESWIGRQLVGLAGIAMLVILITGMVIYFPFTKRQTFFKIRRKNSRQFWADIHKFTGLSSLLFNLVIAGTGAWLGLQVWLMDWTDSKVPNRTFSREKLITPAEDSLQPLDLDLYLAESKQTFPEMIPFLIRPVNNGQRLVEVMGDLPGTVYERYTNKVILDKASGDLLFKYDLRNRGLAEKFYFIQEALHFGDFGGVWLKLFYLLFGLTSGGLSIAGFWIFMKRKQKSMGYNHRQVNQVFVRYTLAIVLSISITAILNNLFGLVVTSFIITFTFYSSIIILILKTLILKEGLFSSWLKVKTKIGLASKIDQSSP